MRIIRLFGYVFFAILCINLGGVSLAMEFSSKAFSDGGGMPVEYTGGGLDVSPPLQWSDPPTGTKSFVLIMDDPDALGGIWSHWVIYNIPEIQSGFEENIPKEAALVSGAKQGINDFGQFGYNGPYPPSGSEHHYVFTLYALDTLLDIPSGEDRKTVLELINGHILAEKTITAMFGR